MRRTSHRGARAALAAGGLSAVLIAGALLPAAPGGAAETRRASQKPDRVVIIVVDALSREIVKRYDMDNIQALMRKGADSPRGYLGHLGSVTVVTHNVVTSGALPKNMGWSSEGYRDVDGLLAGQGLNESDLWFTSDWSSSQMFAVQDDAGYPKLADYLHEMRPDSKVVAVSPKTYAGYAFGGPGADSIVTFSSRNYDCDGDGVNNWRGPSGINVPTYLSAPVCGRFYVDSSSSLVYDTNLSPARMYPLDGNRYTAGTDPAHLGSDVWAADAAIEAMKNEDWSGVFVTLPGVDKAAHMWGSIDDPEGPDPQTHLTNAANVADAQVGKIMDYLKSSGELDNTLVVLTSDHGSVPGRSFHGLDDGTSNRGYYNWYYGDGENGTYLAPQPDLQPLIDTGNIEMSYSDSMLSTWLVDTSKPATRATAAVMWGLPGVSAVWARKGDRYQRVSPVRWGAMRTKGERTWFAAHARELVNTMAAPSGPDMVATLVDDTTYSVAGDHGGIQRRSQQIPIVFAGGGVGARDLSGPVRSVDIMPTVLRRLGITPTHPLDGKAWHLSNSR